MTKKELLDKLDGFIHSFEERAMKEFLPPYFKMIVLKPFDPEVLILAVRKALEKDQ